MIAVQLAILLQTPVELSPKQIHRAFELLNVEPKAQTHEPLINVKVEAQDRHLESVCELYETTEQ